MSSLTSSAADFYHYVVGVDTHAAAHTYAIVSAASGAAVDEASFPTTTAGLHRARNWVSRRTQGDLGAVLIAAEGTGSYGAKLACVLAEAGYRVVEAPTPAKHRGRAKTDGLDALSAARSTLSMPVSSLRDRRAGEIHDALQVLSSARDHLNSERLRSINALTALVRTYALGIEARKALTPKHLALIAAWRHREEPLSAQTGRAEAVRLAQRIRVLDVELAENRAVITGLIEAEAPQLLQLPGVGAVTAAVVLAAWAYPGRVRGEAAFARIAGTCPIPASSGNTVRHRLNRGGDRRLNRAVNTVVLTRMRTDPDTRRYVERRKAEGRTSKEIRRCLKRYVTRQLYRTLSAEAQREGLSAMA